MRNQPLELQIPETSKASFAFSLTRKAALFILVLILLLVGIFTEKVYQFFDQAYYFLFTSFGIFSFLNNTQAEVSSQITMRSWPTMLSYGLLYTSLSFLTLHVYFNNLWKTKITVAFYTAVFALCLCLIVLGKLIPDFVWAYMLCRRIIELVVSPFPIILLVAVFVGYKRKT